MVNGGALKEQSGSGDGGWRWNKYGHKKGSWIEGTRGLATPK